MILELKKVGVRSCLIHVASAKDGVVAMEMLFDLLCEAPFDFVVAVDDDSGSANGWAIEKVGDKFLFQFMSVSSMHGFQKGDGSIYSYKFGYDPERVDWPSVEFGKVPRHCLLTREQVEPLLLQLYRADKPGETAGFVYAPDTWELVC